MLLLNFFDSSKIASTEPLFFGLNSMGFSLRRCDYKAEAAPPSPVLLN